MQNIKPAFRLPAEFEKHKGTWMIWPYRLDTWHDSALPARIAYSNVANAISEFEKVNMVIKSEDIDFAKTLLNSSIEFHTFNFDSEWSRDTSPLFVKDKKGNINGIDFAFDSWGGIYPDYKQDDKLASEIIEYLKYPLIDNDLVLEGGSIHVDGEGTLIATEECLLSPKRKVIFSKKHLENIFKINFGITKTIWIKQGVYKDVVNGHIDNLVSFVKPGVVVLDWTDDQSDPQYQISKDTFDVLSTSTDAKNRPFEIVKIHQPEPMFVTARENTLVGESFYTVGDRLCATYINFYIVNGGVIVPGFGDYKYDKLAFDNISYLFPDRKVVQVPAREILLGGGGIHCITMQEPY